MESAALQVVTNDARRLAQLEKEIAALIVAGRENFYHIGVRLREVQEDDLYLEACASWTFKDYCWEVWGWKERYPYYLIDAARAVEMSCIMAQEISTGQIPKEFTERVVRPLIKLRKPAEDNPNHKVLDVEAVKECFDEAQKHAEMEGRPISSRHTNAAVKSRLGDEQAWLIKPSDNWNFCPVFYGRIDEEKGHGYIPGEVYANCLFYYTKPGDVVVDPMVGSGQIFRVYEDRARWMRPEPWDLKIHAFDLIPRGKYIKRIKRHDARARFPIDHADYVFMDVPYFGMVNGEYSDSPDDLANQSIEKWEKSMRAIAVSCASAQQPGGLCTVVTPNFRDTSTGQIVLAPRLVEQAFKQSGYTLYDVAYQSRRIQQTQTPGMARMNNFAREQRVMLTDMSEILTFRKA